MSTLRFRIYNAVLKRMLTEEESVLGCRFMEGTLYRAPNCTVMQSTGLKDKKRAEMFGSDIVKTSRGIGVVTWTGAARWEIKYADGWEDLIMKNSLPDGEGRPSDECEVIGNIHESPSLLPL